MRITGGEARGIPIKAVGGDRVRPATDRMREAVFASIACDIAGRRFFDLFGGSGAYGLEAWSRGAAGGVFVEKNRAMVQAIRRNADAVARSLRGSVSELSIIQADATRWTPATDDRAGLIFVDPPYELIPVVAEGLFAKFREWLTPDGVVVFEMPGGMEIEPDGWVCFKRIGKGRHQPTCCLYRASER